MTLQDYVGKSAHGKVYTNGHVHEVRVTFTEVADGRLKAETDDVWCSMDAGVMADSVAWVVPIWDDVPVGESPVCGETEERGHEIQLDMD